MSVVYLHYIFSKYFSGGEWELCNDISIPDKHFKWQNPVRTPRTMQYSFRLLTRLVAYMVYSISIQMAEKYEGMQMIA